MPDVLVFALLVLVIGAAGIRLGMLMAPRVGRLADRVDADPGDTGDADRAAEDPGPPVAVATDEDATT